MKCRDGHSSFSSWQQFLDDIERLLFFVNSRKVAIRYDTIKAQMNDFCSFNILQESSNICFSE